MPGDASRDESASSARRCAARARRSRTEAWEVRAPCVLHVGAPHSTPKNAIVLLNRQHSVESDLRPVLLIVGDRDAIVHPAFDQLFKNPEQMVWRHAKHCRAETTKLIERDNTAVGCNFLREAIHEVHFGTDGPFRS